MASARSMTNFVADLDQFTCPVCMEIFCKPVRISCGHDHVFCESCLRGLQAQNQTSCPKCRSPFSPHHCSLANDVEIMLRSSSCRCPNCDAQMLLANLRVHMESCSVVTDYKFQPIKETSQAVPSNLPNRSTFKCPYCGQPNLDCKDMIEHCNVHHRHDRTQVVCPICVSMPWGDPSLRSTNFIQHLNTRHKFEYETYVDYSQDDDEMLRAALQASLQDH